MSAVGYVDKRGRRVEFGRLAEAVASGEAEFDAPLPELLWLRPEKERDAIFLRRNRELGEKVELLPSPTALLRPPRISALDKAHRYYIRPESLVTLDVANAVHLTMDAKARSIQASGGLRWVPEPKFLWEWEPGRFIPLQPDLLELWADGAAVLWDYKTCGGWKMRRMLDPAEWRIGGANGDYLLQANMYRVALESECLREMEEDEDGLPTGVASRVAPLSVGSMRIRARCRDLSPADKAAGVPASATIEVPRLPDGSVKEWVGARIKQHERAWRAVAAGVEPPACSPSDQWRRGAAYAVSKQPGGGGRAVKVFRAEEHGGDAEATRRAAEEYGRERGLAVEARPGLPARCASWCPVAGVCGQLAREFPEIHKERLADWNGCESSEKGN